MIYGRFLRAKASFISIASRDFRYRKLKNSPLSLAKGNKPGDRSPAERLALFLYYGHKLDALGHFQKFAFYFFEMIVGFPRGCPE